MTPAERNAIFRDAALARLASPDRLDARLTLPGYPAGLLAVLAALLVAVVAFCAWLAVN
jgi:hypothetical protein